LDDSAIDPGIRETLQNAEPIYRRYFWESHDRTNKSWIATTVRDLRTIAPDVVPRLERLYETKWFATPVRVDVVWVGNRQGAYTTVQPPHATISSGDGDQTGWTAVEIVFHELSHELVLPLQDRLAAALGDGARAHGVLWHVVQFYLTGAAVQGALAARGITYEPYLYSSGLFDRAWPQYRKPVEAHWKPYVEGQISLEQAIARTVGALR
jgi:hypothetical protein